MLLLRVFDVFRYNGEIINGVFMFDFCINGVGMVGVVIVLGLVCVGYFVVLIE